MTDQKIMSRFFLDEDIAALAVILPEQDVAPVQIEKAKKIRRRTGKRKADEYQNLIRSEHVEGLEAKRFYADDSGLKKKAAPQDWSRIADTKSMRDDMQTPDDEVEVEEFEAVEYKTGRAGKLAL